MPEGSPNRLVFTILTAITRIITLGYVAAAVFAFLESRKLLSAKGDDAYKLEGTTLYVPLVLCVPASIQIDGEIISTDASAGAGECRQLDYLINACASSLLFSAVGAMIYLWIDCMARYETGPFNMSAANGMALYFIFILTQAGICTGALVEQSRFWVRYFSDVIDKIGDSRITDAKSYANTWVLTAVAAAAMVTALVIFMDAMVYRCYVQPSLRLERAEKEERRQASEAMQKQTAMMEQATIGNNSSASQSLRVDSGFDGSEDGGGDVASRKSGFNTSDSPTWTSA